MKNLFFLIASLLCFGTIYSTTNNSTNPSQTTLNKVESKVLICNSKYAYAYHKYKCQGLKRCNSEIIEISLAKAKEQSRKACGYCY